jgi:hypothetical protein
MKGYKAGSPRQSPQHVPSCFPRCTVFYFTSYRTSSGHSVGLYYVRFLQSVWLHKQYKTSWPSPRKNHGRDVRKSSSRRACHRCDQPKIHSLMAFSFATALKVNILSTYFGHQCQLLFDTWVSRQHSHYSRLILFLYKMKHLDPFS